MVGIGRLEDGQQVDGIERRRPVAPGELGGPQVAQDPGEDLAPAGRSEHPDVEQHAVADRSPDQRLAVVGRERSPAVGRVEQEPVRSADDEVTGQADPDEGQPQPRRRPRARRPRG